MKSAEMQPGEIVQILKELYLLYSCSGLSVEQDYITTTELLKFFKDCTLPEAVFSNQSLELIFTSKKTKAKVLTFEVFLEILGAVSKSTYSALAESDSLYYFLDFHVFPLYSYKASNEVKKLEINHLTSELLNEVLPMLREIYIQEFPWELPSTEPKKFVKAKSKQKILKFLNTFKITPSLVGPAKALKICKLLIGNSVFLANVEYNIETLGHVFTFTHFVECLLYCCEVSSIECEDFTQKFFLFLQNIETAKNFSSISINFSLLKARNLVNLMKSKDSDDESHASSTQTLNLSEIRIANLLENLEDLFRIYSTWSKKTQKHLVTLHKLVTMLTDANLIYDKVMKFGVKRYEIELIFSSVSTKKANSDCSEHGKINFNQFFNLLENISKKIYPELEGTNPLKLLISKHLLKLTENTYENEVRALHHMLKDSNLLEALYGLSHILSPFAKFYMSENGQMSIDQFLKFCTEFCIFPDLIPKIKLSPIFYCLARDFAKNTMALTGTRSLGKLLSCMDEYVEAQFIDFDFFCDCIAICALESVSVNRSPDEKIRAAIEKIAQSPGAANISLKSGHTRCSNLDRNDFLKCFISEKAPEKLTFLQQLYNKPVLK